METINPSGIICVVWPSAPIYCSCMSNICSEFDCWVVPSYLSKQTELIDKLFLGCRSLHNSVALTHQNCQKLSNPLEQKWQILTNLLFLYIWSIYLQTVAVKAPGRPRMTRTRAALKESIPAPRTTSSSISSWGSTAATWAASDRSSPRGRRKGSSPRRPGRSSSNGGSCTTSGPTLLYDRPLHL